MWFSVFCLFLFCIFNCYVQVEEGGRKVITNKYLEIRTLDFGSFIYNVSAPPLHGWISVFAPNKVTGHHQPCCTTLAYTALLLSERLPKSANAPWHTGWVLL